MELELQRTLLEDYQLMADMVLTQEEVLESIVPDAFPDISRIVSAFGSACLTAKQLGSGTVKVMGSANISILYLPEGDPKPRALTVSIPFQCNGDNPKIKESDHLHINVLSTVPDVRLINPRKLFVKAELKLAAKVYAGCSREIVCDLASDDDPTIQKLWKQSEHFSISAVMEKTFEFSDTLRQSASKPHMDDLLLYSVAPFTIEARYIGRKLVCKGELLLSALYCSGTEVNANRFELPFSQVLDLDSSFDEGNPDVSIYLKHTSCVLRNGELEVTVEAVLQASLWSHKDVTLLSDIYSTSAPLATERTSGVLCTACEWETHREGSRKFCESGIPAKQVLDCSLTLSPITTQETQALTEFDTVGEVCILYLSEDNALCSVSYRVPVKHSVEKVDGTLCKCSCRLAGEVIAVPVTGGFEVRFETEFVTLKTRLESAPYISAVKKESAVEKTGQNPSVIIRMVDHGESLWEIAKSCGATIDDIYRANELASEAVIPGTILLIPTRR